MDRYNETIELSMVKKVCWLKRVAICDKIQIGNFFYAKISKLKIERR